MVNPYNDNHVSEHEWIRTFSEDTDIDELIWHRDRRDREITVLSGEGWMFQYENELPFVLQEKDVVFIEKMCYHRLIKGTGDLMLKITEE